MGNWKHGSLTADSEVYDMTALETGFSFHTIPAGRSYSGLLTGGFARQIIECS